MIEIVPDYLQGWRLAYENEKDAQVVTTIKTNTNTDMLNFNASSGLETSDGVVRSMISAKGEDNELR